MTVSKERKGKVKAKAVAGVAHEDPSAISEDSMALRFAAEAGESLRWVPAHKSWYEWRGDRWARVSDVVAEDHERHWIRGMVANAARQNGTTGLLNTLSRYLSAARISNVTRLAKAPLLAETADFDAHPDLLNCHNGTLDLSTGELREHRREDMLTLVVPCDYNKSATARRWERLLRTALSACEDSEGTYHFLQKAFGYALTGDLGEHVFFYLYGPPGTGKSTVVEIPRRVLGSYSASAEADIFMTMTQRSEVLNTLAKLGGTRLVHVSEVPQGTTWKTSQLNKMVEGVPVTVKLLYADVYSMEPQFSLFFTANHQPRVKSPRDGIWRRINVVPFNHAIPKDKQDKHLVPKIVKREGEGILAWMVEGYKMWREEGFIDEPVDVTQARGAYEEEQSEVVAFLADWTIEDEDSYIQRSKLYADYKAWHNARKRRGEPIKKGEFNDEMAKGHALDHTRDHGDVWRGLKRKVTVRGE